MRALRVLEGGRAGRTGAGSPKLPRVTRLRHSVAVTARAKSADHCVRASRTKHRIGHRMTTTPRNHERVVTHDRQGAAPRRHVGWTVAVSLLTGLLVGLLLVAAAPFIEPEERDVTGALLLGFAVGWAMLAVLSTRLTDQPQRWASAPAAFMGVSGLLLIGF